MGKKKIVNRGKNKSNYEILKQKTLICISIATLLFTIGLFVLKNLDVRGCDGLMGGLGGDCTSTNYALWGFFSIPLAVLSLISALSKKVIPSFIGIILFLVFNICLICIAEWDRLRSLIVVCIIFSLILFFVEVYLLKKKNTK